MKTKSALIILSILSFVSTAFSQGTDASVDTKMNDFLRSSDKLYVVISILATIFTVIIVYLVYQDYKIKQLEKELKNKSSKN